MSRMARANGKPATKSHALRELDHIARIAPKKWRTRKALREAGFQNIPGGLSDAVSASRFRRLARQMRALRQRAGLTRAQLARRMGIPVRNLTDLELKNPGELTLSVL